SLTDATDLRRELSRAVLRPERLDQRVVRLALPVEEPLSTWVRQVWSLQWTVLLPPTSTAIIPHPTVHLTVEDGPPGEVRHGHRMPAALLHGVPPRGFSPTLPPSGWVVGLHLAPGAVRDLMGRPANEWAGRVVPWAQAWPGWELAELYALDCPRERAEVLRSMAQQVLGVRTPSADGLLARRVEELIRTDERLRSVADLADRVGLTPRSLQRLCREHHGVTPRWLLRRARVLDAHELLSSSDLDVAEIAERLGWYDQAHLTRDYTAVTGVPPARLRRALDADRGDP
ncbi:MAG: helix-turn-helix domain-containing protein, partial [Pseudonocardiaceae bacterium]